jgi:hypothetical protein
VSLQDPVSPGNLSAALLDNIALTTAECMEDKFYTCGAHVVREGIHVAIVSGVCSFVHLGGSIFLIIVSRGL